MGMMRLYGLTFLIFVSFVLSVQSFHQSRHRGPSLTFRPQNQHQHKSQQYHRRQHQRQQQLQVLFGVNAKRNQDSSSSTATTVNDEAIKVGTLIGSGSYGTVHLLTLDGDQAVPYIGKRPWKEEELEEKETKNARERAQRCMYYWEVEAHCFSKLPSHPQIPPYFGTREDWMVFGLVGEEQTPAPTLSDLMAMDLEHPRDLKNTGEALGCSSYGETLDRVMESLLNVLMHVHENQIVHRDIKPSNLLVHNNTVLLMDFGSAADLEPIGVLKRRKGLENGNRVAVSPIYCAPEVFIELNRNPTGFDIFSSGLLFCQLLFSYLDERMDAGFHQQLEEVKWDLNLWLENELGTKLRPRGLEHALEYLGERKGLWTLLQDMLSADPMNRPGAKKALRRFQKILNGEGSEDSPFFTMVIESMETCEIPTMSRPLHFVATFSRDKPLGLVLSEKDDEVDDPFWREATKDAQDGEIFVLEVIPGGQADELGIFEVGDRLDGVGELPFTYGGFEKAIEMLQDLPRKERNVRLHFDRIAVRSNEAINMVPTSDVEIHIVDRGAWSSMGRRKAQEDAFVLYEIHDTKDRSVLVAGVMDGHGGTAASTMVSSEFPDLLSDKLLVNRLGVQDAVESAWETVCTTYRERCNNIEECTAEYDPTEGVLMANTGSEDLIAGTTASIMALDEKTAMLTVLNCGDSRSLVATKEGKVKFVTKDHKPQSEEERILEGIKNGLDYSPPQCSWSRWWIKVGDYQYSVARSLEGPFATSKGIVSDPDLTTIQVLPGDILISASDGLWDVMDSGEVALDLYKMRKQGMSARETAKALCSLALKKGTSDNVSAVVVYL